MKSNVVFTIDNFQNGCPVVHCSVGSLSCISCQNGGFHNYVEEYNGYVIKKFECSALSDYQKTVINHRALWNWLYITGYDKYKFFYEHAVEGCYLCEFSRSKYCKENDTDYIQISKRESCKYCLAKDWGNDKSKKHDGVYCEKPGSLYYEWRYADSIQEKKTFAKIIRDMPLKTEEELEPCRHKLIKTVLILPEGDYSKQGLYELKPENVKIVCASCGCELNDFNVEIIKDSVKINPKEKSFPYGQYKPEEDELYYGAYSTRGIPFACNWNDNILDIYSVKRGISFRTEEEAQLHLDWLEAVAEYLACIHKFNEGWKPNWKSDLRKKYFLKIVNPNDKISIGGNFCEQDQPDEYYIKSEIAAQKVIDELGVEKIKFALTRKK